MVFVEQLRCLDMAIYFKITSEISNVCNRMGVHFACNAGSGKMNVPLLATLVLREKLSNAKGVCIVTLPLSSIMNQKMKNDVCEAAVLSMGGELSTSTGNDEDASLSCNLKELFNGSFPVLFGHPESFDTKLGQHILRELQKLGRLILICIDEFHQVRQTGNWNSYNNQLVGLVRSFNLLLLKWLK